jgi:phosphohistidine phosphatase SixA
MRYVLDLALRSMLALAFGAAPAFAQDQIFFVVRHAERADAPAVPGSSQVAMKGTDPALSAAGHQRAKRLADALRDAGVAQIVTTEYLRTRQTAAPLAQRLNLQPVTGPESVDALVDLLRDERRTTLVIGHSNTVPQILKGLGVSTNVTLGEQDYDDLFVVVRNAAGASTLVRLKY